MKESERKKKIDAECLDWAKVLQKALEFLKTEKPKYRWTAKECEIILRYLRRNNSENITKRNQYIIFLFDDWKDRAPIAIADWGGNFVCDDDAEEKDEAIGDKFDADGLAIII